MTEPDYIAEFMKTVGNLLGDIKDPSVRDFAKKYAACMLSAFRSIDESIDRLRKSINP